MVFKSLDSKNYLHDQILFCYDETVGLKSIVAIHSLRLGPAVGGCRMYPYATEKEALEDVLLLSEAMSYKAAVADLPMGGGKSVIIGDPKTEKTPELLRAYGRRIDILNGNYIAAKDMGITSKDISFMAEESSHVIGRPLDEGGSGDPSPPTAVGVYLGIKEACLRRLKKESLKGLRVGVHGVGAVGSSLVASLVKDEAQVFVYDISKRALEEIKKRHPEIEVVLEEQELFSKELEVFAPCSIGGILNEKSVETLNCQIVAGSANNQLKEEGVGKRLLDRGILYIPDFVINSGGLIQVAASLFKKEESWMNKKFLQITHSIKRICEISEAEKQDSAKIAIRIAKEKIKLGKTSDVA